MHRTMMPSTERHHEFIADLATERARLGKSEVVRIRRLATAQQTRLLRDIPQVRPVAIAARRRDREGALVDALRSPRIGAFGGGIDLGFRNLSHWKPIPPPLADRCGSLLSATFPD